MLDGRVQRKGERGGKGQAGYSRKTSSRMVAGTALGQDRFARWTETGPVLGGDGEGTRPAGLGTSEEPPPPALYQGGGGPGAATPAEGSSGNRARLAMHNGDRSGRYKRYQEAGTKDEPEGRHLR